MVTSSPTLFCLEIEKATFQLRHKLKSPSYVRKLIFLGQSDIIEKLAIEKVANIWAEFFRTRIGCSSGSNVYLWRCKRPVLM